jgi:hypothetical protein
MNEPLLDKRVGVVAPVLREQNSGSAAKGSSLSRMSGGRHT